MSIFRLLRWHLGLKPVQSTLKYIATGLRPAALAPDLQHAAATDRRN